MDEPIRKLTPEEIRAQFKKATAKWQGETMQVFANDDIRKQHEDYVRQNVASGSIPF
jgi:hypothetical protein